MTNVGQLVASKKYYRHKVDTINVKEIFYCFYSMIAMENTIQNQLTF